MTRLKVVALATLALSALAPMKPAAAALFSKADLDPSKLILVASPYGNNAHQLLIVEQVSNSRTCWSESGVSPTTVNPLLAEFDFTGICGRSTDANGYSIRMGDQDLGLQYSLRVVQRNGDLLLVGAPTTNRTAPEIQVGRAGGTTNGFAKLYLNPGWRITRRVYANQALGHYYLTNDQPLNSAIAAAPVLPQTQRPLPFQPSLPLPVSRPDMIITPGSNSATGSTPSLFPRPASTSIPIPVPPPETVATGSIPPQPTSKPLPASKPLPVSKPPVAVPVTIPVVRSKKPVLPPINQAAAPSRAPVSGKPIRVPLPAAANRPIFSTPNEVIQPPAAPAPMTQPAITKLPVPQPAANTPKPSTVKPGDFVVPTMTL